MTVFFFHVRRRKGHTNSSAVLLVNIGLVGDILPLILDIACGGEADRGWKF